MASSAYRLLTLVEELAFFCSSRQAHPGSADPATYLRHLRTEVADGFPDWKALLADAHLAEVKKRLHDAGAFQTATAFPRLVRALRALLEPAEPEPPLDRRKVRDRDQQTSAFVLAARIAGATAHPWSLPAGTWETLDAARGVLEQQEGRPARAGRPRLPPSIDRKRTLLVRKWWQSHEAGVAKKDFCADNRVSMKMLNRYLACERMRRHRAGKRMARA